MILHSIKLKVTDNKEIRRRLNKIFRQVLNNNQINLDINTTNDDLEQWDSLNHILLILEIEKYFSIKITAGEITELKSIRMICDLINKKVSKEV